MSQECRFLEEFYLKIFFLSWIKCVEVLSFWSKHGYIYFVIMYFSVWSSSRYLYHLLNMYCFILCISFSLWRMSDETFDLIRFSLIPVFCLLRFCLTTVHLQSHLNMAKERFDSMKMEAGRINSLELQKMVGITNITFS